MQHVKDAGKGVKDWHASREHENAPQVCVVLGIDVVTRDLVSSVQLVHLILEGLLRVDSIFLSLFLQRLAASSIPHSAEQL